MALSVYNIRKEVLLAIIGTVFITLVIMGILQYYSEIQLRTRHIIDNSMISLQPVVSLATRSVDGGNIMYLQNQAAQDIYQVNPGLLYLKITGTSAGSPKTEYAEAIPPKAIEYTYINKVVADSKIPVYAKRSQESAAQGAVIDYDENLVLVKNPLAIKNGGAIYAVFAAQELSGIGADVFVKIMPFMLVVFMVSLGVAYTMGSKYAKPITDIIVQIDGLTAQVNDSASDIAAAVEEQAAIAVQQSSTMMEITTTMKDVSDSSSQIADSAKSVVENSKHAVDVSEACAGTLNRLKTKMGGIISEQDRNIQEILELDKKAQEIGKIMNIINDIADQTKMIAFNAAIEAASAGELGKRFGVVAFEIRRLADNVMESTREIENKIEEIQKVSNRLVFTSESSSKAIDEGAKTTETSLEEIARMVEGIEAVSESAFAISLSTQQQKTASNQVLTALTEVNQGIHQSSASIRQISTATHNLSNVSGSLRQLLDIFKPAKRAV